MQSTPQSKGERANTSLPGVVQKIIKSPDRRVPEKAEIRVVGADDLYREIRIENALTIENGDKVSLRPVTFSSSGTPMPPRD